MRLPDFSNDAHYNSLREQMGAELISWNPDGNWTSIDLGNLLITTGVDLNLEQIEPDRDRTLVINGQKVVVYIRDQYRPRDSDPEGLCRFHIADCSTLQQMRRQNRYQRYVAATRRDGLFIVNFLGDFGEGTREDNVECELYVCKNCLTRLNYNGYRRRRGGSERVNIWRRFDLREFFERYDTQISEVPTATDISDPPNEYAPDQNQISRDYRSRAGWTCQACFIDFRHRPEFLDVHHRNGRRNDNTDQNLVALCVGCHAQEPQHQHMELMPRYREFQRWINVLEEEVD